MGTRSLSSSLIASASKDDGLYSKVPGLTGGRSRGEKLGTHSTGSGVQCFGIDVSNVTVWYVAGQRGRDRFGSLSYFEYFEFPNPRVAD